jgi:outer membrane receptor for ferric coprogen and ferric-rhodotorulic acid
MVHYVGRLPQLDIPSYHTVDLRLAYRLTETLGLVVAGQNLLHDVYQEFISTTAVSTGVERSVYVQLAGRFE